jgi:hypothetical protein
MKKKNEKSEVEGKEQTTNVTVLGVCPSHKSLSRGIYVVLCCESGDKAITFVVVI